MCRANIIINGYGNAVNSRGFYPMDIL